MQTIGKRLEALETKIHGSPLMFLLVERIFHGDTREYQRKTTYKGQEFIQEKEETPDQFHDRVEAHVMKNPPGGPNMVVLRMDHLDLAL